VTEDQTPKRANVATVLAYQHEEAMARATQPRTVTPSYEISQKSPAGKSPGFEFTILHSDPEEAARQAEEWAERFPAPQPVVKP
jgi:hypothetical protein